MTTPSRRTKPLPAFPAPQDRLCCGLRDVRIDWFPRTRDSSGWELQHHLRAAHMQETIEQSTIAPEAADAIADAAARATTWAGEPFLHEGESPVEILAPGTARRRALDDALAEIDQGLRAPSPAVEGALRADARARARPLRASAAPRRRRRAAPPPDRRPRGDAHRADRGSPAGRRGAERQRSRRRGRSRRRTRTTTTKTCRRARRTTRRPTRSAPAATRTTPAPSAATASATRPRRGRRSPPPASSRRRGRWAC